MEKPPMFNTVSRMRRQEGFTLIELMIVMVVLGILAGLILFAVDPFSQAADDAVSGANDDTCDTAYAAAQATETDSDSATTFSDKCDEDGNPIEEEE
jgi:prepilin-type N-terminal cleavage/methylation domain-containing protein